MRARGKLARKRWPETVISDELQDLRERCPDREVRRIALAAGLALDLETCRSLLAGEPVDPDRLDKARLERAKNRLLVRLDFAEIDLI